MTAMSDVQLDDEVLQTTFGPAELYAAKVTPERVKILNEGAQITNGDRDAEYGPPILNLSCAGELKQLVRKHARRELSPGEWEALDLVLTKISRIITGLQPKRDTYVDAATYMAIAGEIALSASALSVK